MWSTKINQSFIAGQQKSIAISVETVQYQGSIKRRGNLVGRSGGPRGRGHRANYCGASTLIYGIMANRGLDADAYIV